MLTNKQIVGRGYPSALVPVGDLFFLLGIDEVQQFFADGGVNTSIRTLADAKV